MCNENKPKVKISTSEEGTFNEALENLKNDQDVQEAVKGLKVISVSLKGNKTLTEVKLTLSAINPVDVLLKELLEDAIRVHKTEQERKPEKSSLFEELLKKIGGLHD